MRRPSRRELRVTALSLVLLWIVLLGHSALTAGEPAATDLRESNSSVPYGTSLDLEPRLADAEGETGSISGDTEVTVVATQGFFVSDETAELVAISRRGEILYRNATYKVYFDVDPVEDERWTVEYVASKQINDEQCEGFSTYWCSQNVIERVNLSTGEVDRLYSKKTQEVTGTRWHDVDRINDTHVAIADIARDSVRIVNVTSGKTTWEWRATNIYDYEGEERPQDWTHLNDVEVLEDGSFMLSMRNMDEVVFVRPGDGYLPDRTLGEDGNHDILYEQHNPDYIPEERGGPAVLVADSENNRLVEFQQREDGWEQTWFWRDTRLQWPRDADRLPNDRTLVVDSHGDRVLEVSPNGSIAWSVHVGMPYDVERLGTGDESSNGRAATSIADTESGVHSTTPVDELTIAMKDALPSPWVNSVLYIGPGWFRFHDVILSAGLLLTGLVWGGVEYRWRPWSVTGLARRGWTRLRSWASSVGE